jgi:hypothetical protein
MAPVCVAQTKQTRRCSLWLLVVLIALLVACREPVPTPFPTSAGTTRAAATPTVPANQRYTNDSAGFSVELPPGWLVVDQGVTALGKYYLVGPEPLGPGPASSALFVASRASLAAKEAAAALACAACETEPELAAATIGDIPAQRALLGDPVAVEWFFVEHEDWLIFFTLHDPVTLETRTDLLETFRLEAPAPSPTPDATPEATGPVAPPATPTPLPTAAPDATEEAEEAEAPAEELPYFDDPVAVAVDWFAAVLADPSGESALPYMSAALQQQLEPGQSPLVLLALPEPPSVYEIEVAGEPGRAIDLLANLTLPGGAETTRLLRLVFDAAIGWRLDEIIVPES